MADTLYIRIYDQSQPVYTNEIHGRIELGRQENLTPEERLYSKRLIDFRRIDVGKGRPPIEKENFTRVIVASKDESNVSRDHAFIEPLGNGRARLENLSSKAEICLSDGTKLAPLLSCELTLPATLTLGRRLVSVLDRKPDEPIYQRLSDMVSHAGMTIAGTMPMSTMAIALKPGDDVDTEEFLRCLKVAMGVLQSATNSTDFFFQAAKAVVETVELDYGYVMLLDKDEWRVQAAWTAVGQTLDPGVMPSRQVLAQVRSEQRTLWHVPEAADAEGHSLVGISAVVASPILVDGEVVGAIYGDRRRYASPGLPPNISKIDAMMMDVLAACVASGVARMKIKEKADQYKHFFGPDLARHIEDQPERIKLIEEGEESEITLLFCDIRNFSAISERIGPKPTVRWVNEAMSMLSDCVLAHEGLIVDYIGDELMAMWGAPKEQPDHADRACRAALDMIDLLPEMNKRFLGEIGTHMDVGIGINSGVAHVGNTGSRHKFKYGPLGNTVNVASRVQGVTKHLKVRLLITEATKQALGAGFATRRIGQVKVVNIGEPVSLYELAEAGNEKWEAFCLQYESALKEFEDQGFAMASRILGTLVMEDLQDGPSKILLARAVNALVDPETFNSVWVPPGK
jgi:adenylate cyclase